MKSIIFLLLALTLCGATAAQTAGKANHDGWRLVWSDEFSKDGPPDPANWTPERGFARNEEAQWYQSENAVVRGGMLTIEARREKKANPNYDKNSGDWRKNREFAEYTSASIETRGKREFQYGRFEMRARIETASGLWPAFWTLGVDGEWPSNGEIDIMEFYRGNLLANVAWGTDKCYTAHWDSTSRPVKEFDDPNWAKKFHVWRMDWDADAIRLFVDGKLLNETLLKDTINADGTNPFRQPHYALLDFAIGGQNGGDPSQTKFPARFFVDYVRVYQKVVK